MTQATDGTQAATAIYRKDYQAPPFWIDTVDLSFDLEPAKTRVLNKMRLRRNPDVPAQALRLALASGSSAFSKKYLGVLRWEGSCCMAAATTVSGHRSIAGLMWVSSLLFY